MHITTLMLLNITLSVVFCITLAVTALRAHRELMLLAAALGAHAMGCVLLSLRGQIDDIWSIVVANSAIAVALSQSERTDSHLAVLFIDLDNLKVLNDTRGHKAGDLLLVESARRLRTNVREVDTVARLGGDEFVVLLSPLDDDVVRARAQAQIVAEKILRSLKTPYVLQVSSDEQTGLETHLGSGSIGVHVFKGPIESVDALFDNADTAMYHAKQAGRGRIQMFDDLAGQGAVDALT